MTGKNKRRFERVSRCFARVCAHCVSLAPPPPPPPTSSLRQTRTNSHAPVGAFAAPPLLSIEADYDG
jgi:hypothetical protein